MARQVIGVCAATEQARWGQWDQPAVLLPRSYADSLHAAGGLMLMLPPHELDPDGPDQILGRIDALVLAGGADVDPGLYGAEPHPATGPTRPERDRFELELARAALERDLPLLGICRGMEVLNVARGGTLLQHLPDELGHDRHRPVPGGFAEHDVRLEPGSLAARAVGAERVTVKAHHHQGVDRLGEGLVATGWSEPDEVVEAIELPDRGFALGVLWHPEEEEDSPTVIEALIAAASRR
ncbi:MAG: gamma-glutamyl-gamma-aminobutyrate hydrolase family protein [Solirubrobacterales bacterium]